LQEQIGVIDFVILKLGMAVNPLLRVDTILESHLATLIRLEGNKYSSTCLWSSNAS
jgi:hypothetical protein